MNLYAYASGDPVNRRDRMGTIDEIVVPGTRPDCGYDCCSYLPSDFLVDIPFDTSWWDSQSQFMNQLQQQLLQALVDEIVVTAKKEKRLQNVKIDFSLKYPLEQLWFVLRHGTIVFVPTKAEPVKDKCGNDIGKNVPDAAYPCRRPRTSTR